MIEVKQLDPHEWAALSESAHLVVHNEQRPFSLDRIDFALLCVEGSEVLVYVTAKELDAESLYWQYGGAFPTASKSIVAFRCFQKMLSYCQEKEYKRVSLYVKNDNFPMLKFCLAQRFKAIGLRTFAGEVFLEMFKELTGGH